MNNYQTLADSQTISNVIAALAARGVEAFSVANSAEALTKIQQWIPAGASVMNGSSVTLEQIGFVDYLKTSAHSWNNLHEAILAETDKEKQLLLRKQSVLSDYYLGSVHALSQDGQFIIASNTGSQLPHIVFTSKNLIFVVGTQKIVPTLADAFARLEEYVLPREDAHMKERGAPGSQISKVILFRKENPIVKRSVRMILVSEVLGY